MIPEIRLLVVGDGPDYEKYKEIIEEKNLSEHIILTGKVPWKEIPSYYQLANIFLTASKTETQGLTVVEAMASGVVPLCIEDESFLSIVIDDLNGKIFRNEKECKSIVLELWKNKEKIKKLSKQARINSERYSTKYFAESILDVYNYALKHRENRLGVIGKIVDKIIGDKDEMDNQ